MVVKTIKCDICNADLEVDDPGRTVLVIPEGNPERLSYGGIQNVDPDAAHVCVGCVAAIRGATINDEVENRSAMEES